MLKGLNDNPGQSNSMERASYRVPWIQSEGAGPAFIHEARIIDINLVNWTVDVRTQFDRRYYLNIQVMSPYSHPASGEGIYAFPEVGAKCLVCIPSDGPPPFVLGFIMPVTTLGDVSTDEAPAGTTSPTQPASAPTGATYAGGRIRAKPGDIYLRGRDGNFCILHRGGVLQIGSTTLAQRIYIPINNIVTDISQNYHHYNTGGAINWFVQNGPSTDNPPTCFKQTIRLHANEAQATVRVSMGSISDVLGVDPKAVGGLEIAGEGIGADSNPVICEVVIAPEDINNDDGTLTKTTRGSAKLQFAFDRAGGGYLWAAGSVILATKKKLIVRAEQDISVSTKQNLALSAVQSARIDGGKLLELTGKLVKIGPGEKRVAFVGSSVLISIPPGALVAKIPPPISAFVPVSSVSDPTGLLPITLLGAVSDGRENVLV